MVVCKNGWLLSVAEAYSLLLIFVCLFFFSGLSCLVSVLDLPIGTACWIRRVLSLMFGWMLLLFDYILPLSVGGTFALSFVFLSLLFGVLFFVEGFFLFVTVLFFSWFAKVVGSCLLLRYILCY